MSTVPSRALPMTLLLILVACGGSEPAAHVAPPRPRAVVPPPEPVLVEHPLTRAQWNVATDWHWRHSVEKAEYVALAYPLEGGGAGVLVEGDRAIATPTEMKRVATGEKLRDLCVAKNGRFTAALRTGEGGGAKLFVGDRFDGSLAEVGEYLHSSSMDDRTVWLVSSREATSLVDCASGRIERVAGPMESGYIARLSSGVRILSLRAANANVATCFLRAGASTTWTKEGDCRSSDRSDGSILIAKPRGREMKCAFVLDASGKKLPCDSPVGPRRSEPEKLSLANARFYAPSKLVTTGPQNALYRTTPGGAFDPSAAVDPTKRSCVPLLPTSPLFACLADDTHVAVVRIDPDGSPHEELRRPRPRTDATAWRPEDKVGEWYVGWDGGVAVAGDCSGVPGDVACVRSANGSWRSVSFSEPLVKALSRTAPGTRLVPRGDGRLFVGTATTEGLLGGAPHVVIYDAEAGAGTTVEKLPVWILGSLGGAARTSFGWSTRSHVRAWPLEREHPAFHTHEFCRADLDLEGHFDADCVQGRVYPVGRMGLWEKQPGDLWETLDAGQSWTQVALPKGLVTSDVECEAAGCRVGPYFRLGWGR